MSLANYLSRVHPNKGKTIELETTIHAVAVTPNKLDELRQETRKDPELGPLLEQIIQGWPDEAKKVQKNLRKAAQRPKGLEH